MDNFKRKSNRNRNPRSVAQYQSTVVKKPRVARVPRTVAQDLPVAPVPVMKKSRVHRTHVSQPRTVAQDLPIAPVMKKPRVPRTVAQDLPVAPQKFDDMSDYATPNYDKGPGVLSRVGDHLKRNWKKYALGSAVAAAAGVGIPAVVNRYKPYYTGEKTPETPVPTPPPPQVPASSIDKYKQVASAFGANSPQAIQYLRKAPNSQDFVKHLKDKQDADLRQQTGGNTSPPF